MLIIIQYLMVYGIYFVII